LFNLKIGNIKMEKIKILVDNYKQQLNIVDLNKDLRNIFGSQAKIEIIFPGHREVALERLSNFLFKEIVLDNKPLFSSRNEIIRAYYLKEGVGFSGQKAAFSDFFSNRRKENHLLFRIWIAAKSKIGERKSKKHILETLKTILQEIEVN